MDITQIFVFLKSITRYMELSVSVGMDWGLVVVFQ